MVQNLFDNNVHSTGRFFQASILYVVRQFGVRAMMGLQLKYRRQHQRWLVYGNDGYSRSIEITPDILRGAAEGQLDLNALFKKIDEYIAHTPSEQVHSIAILRTRFSTS